MSIEALQAVLEHSEQRTEARLVLLAIANFANADGIARPSAVRLAHMARIRRQSVWRIIKRLLNSGELTLDRRGGGRRVSNHYRITLLGIPENSHLRDTVSETNSHLSVTISEEQNSHPSVTLLEQNSHPTATKQSPQGDPNLYNNNKEREEYRSTDPEVGFLDQKPTPDWTASAVHAHVKSKSSKKLNAIPPGYVALSPFVDQGQGETDRNNESHRNKKTSQQDPSLKALSLWFRNELLARYPKNRIGHADVAFSWLKNHPPDEAGRTAIVKHLEAWKNSAEWQRNDGQYVCDISNFLKSPKYQEYPPDYTVPSSEPQRKEEIWSR